MALTPIKLNKQQAEHLNVGSCLVVLGYTLAGLEEVMEELKDEYPDILEKYHELLASLDTASQQFSNITEFTHEEES